MQLISGMIGQFSKYKEFWERDGFQKSVFSSEKITVIHYSSFDPPILLTPMFSFLLLEYISF
jgi:hypothetical protein